MALQSQLFRNDPKLEAAAVSDPAHIMQGAKGEHVRKIQLALNKLDRANLNADGAYGPKTAAAVLAYKKKRNIVNRSYQTQPDSIVGKMTIARLDEEMAASELLDDPQTVRCLFPPASPQITRQSFAFTSAPATAADEITGFTLLAEARASLPLAKSWVLAAIAKIESIEGKRIERTPGEIAFHQQIERHFKVDIPNVSDGVARDRLRKIKELFLKIQRVLIVIGTDRLVGNPGVPDKATAPLGGIDFPNKFITIGRDFHNSNANMRAAVLIHEGGHFADRTCSHAASEQPAPNGSPIEDKFGTAVNPKKLNYAQLDFDLHMQNAYSFAQCALHNGLARDQRPP